MNSMLLAAAVSGIVMGASGLANAQPRSVGTTEIFGETDAQPLDNSNPAAKHACKGQNECKGQGGCKTDKHACKGQNECKGQGGCRTDGKKDEKGGTKHDCSGPSGCGSK